MSKRPFTFLCIASECKGIPFMREAKQQGCRVLVLMDEEHKQAEWPWDAIDEHFVMPDLSKQPDITYAVSYLMRSHNIDRIVALDDYDVATAASLREHLRIPGMGESIVRHFRDKLAMRVRARDAGMAVPPFTAVFNYDTLRHYLDTVPGPWVLKPRFDAGAVGIRKLHEAEQVWRALDELGDQQSFYLLEQFLPGDVYHIDSLTWDQEVVFAIASKYGTPPLAVTSGGGIFNTRILDRQSEEAQTLYQLNQELMTAFGQQRGVAHTEFIRANADGRFYFLETAARVGGANIDKLVKAASGIELWQEAARIEIASAAGEAYQPPATTDHYAGLIICLAQQEHPDLSAYQDAEIVWRLPKTYHAGLIVSSPDATRIEQLLGDYNQRFAQDFLAVAPPKSNVRTNI